MHEIDAIIMPCCGKRCFDRCFICGDKDDGMKMLAATCVMCQSKRFDEGFNRNIDQVRDDNDMVTEIVVVDNGSKSSDGMQTSFLFRQTGVRVATSLKLAW